MSENFRGALIMMICMSAFVLNDAFVRLAGDSLPLAQILFIRGLITTVLLLAFAIYGGVFSLKVSKKYSNYSQDNLDGLTVELQKCWFNLRPSNTEPLLRLNLEAEDEASYETTLQEVMDLIELNKK